MSEVRPRNQYVLVERDDVTASTKVALPDSVREDMNKMNPRGTVLAVGPGRLNDKGYRQPVLGAVKSDIMVTSEDASEVHIFEPLKALDVGDRVILRAYALQAYTVVDAEKNTVLVDEADILAVVEE